MGTASREISVGLGIGQYRVLSTIAQGGMGVVYRATHTASGEVVALKTVRKIEPRSLGALRAEIAALQAIRHPGVVRVVDQGLHEGLPWYAMELLEGRTMADFNRSLWSSKGGGGPQTTTTAATSPGPSSDTPGTSPIGVSPSGPHNFGVGQRPHPGVEAAAGRLREVVALYRALCAPLSHLHGRGLVHRDLKPANIFVRTDGTPVLVDFGLISHAGGTIGRESLGSGPAALGTVSYVAPEQIQKRFVDARADLYSLGCMLYQSVTGHPPFEGRERDVIERHLGEAPTPPSHLVDGLPPELETLILGLLAKSPQDRIGYAADVADLLSRYLGDEPQPLESHYLYRAQISGRHDLLRALSDAASRMASGPGDMLLLGGESGIGKTFLVSEFARLQRGARRRVIAGECVPVPTGSPSTEPSAGPLHPFRRFFQSIADECRRGSPALAERLLGPRAGLLATYEPSLQTFATPSGDLQTVELPAQAARERVLQCLTDTLAAYADEDPLILVFDDLQWADELTLAFLQSLTPEFLRQHKLLIVGTYRVEEISTELASLLDRPTVTRLSVGRLDERTVEAIAREMLAMKAAAPALTRFLRERADGNPFFVAEYLRLLASERLLNRVDGYWVAGTSHAQEPNYEALPVPLSLEGIVNRRVAGLGDEVRSVLEAASVLGREFAVDVLASMTELSGDALATALREARNRHVIDPIDDYRQVFSHDKLRETTYAQLAPERLTQLHRGAAKALQGAYADSPEFPEHYAEIARHLQRAGEMVDAIEFLDRAAQVAWSKSANREAIAYLKDAIEHVRHLNLPIEKVRLARWHRQIGDALWGLGQPEEAASYLRQAAALLEHPAPVSKPRLVAALLGQIVRQFFHRVLPGKFLGSGKDRTETFMEAARAHERLQEVLYFSGDALAMSHASISNLNLGERAGTSAQLAISYINAFATSGIITARKLAESYRRRAAEVNERFPQPAITSYFRMMAGVYALGIADWDTARRELNEGMDLAQKIGFRRRFEDNCSIKSIADYLHGSFGDSLTASISVYASSARGDVQTRSWALVQRAAVHLVQNQIDDALAALDEAAPFIGEGHNTRMEYAWFQSILAVAQLRKGNRPAALAAADRSYARITQGAPVYFTWMEATPALAEVLFDAWKTAPTGTDKEQIERKIIRVGRTMRAQARVFPAAAPAMHLWRGNLLWERGKPQQALEAWQKALSAARTLRMPHEEARALRALARASSRAEAQRLLDESSRLFRELGAEYDLSHQPPS